MIGVRAVVKPGSRLDGQTATVQRPVGSDGGPGATEPAGRARRCEAPSARQR